MLKLYLVPILQAFFQSAQHLYEKREGSGSITQTNGSGWPKKHADPADQDPQHRKKESQKESFKKDVNEDFLVT